MVVEQQGEDLSTEIDGSHQEESAEDRAFSDDDSEGNSSRSSGSEGPVTARSPVEILNECFPDERKSIADFNSRKM